MTILLDVCRHHCKPLLRRPAVDKEITVSWPEDSCSLLKRSSISFLLTFEVSKFIIMKFIFNLIEVAAGPLQPKVKMAAVDA